MTTLTPRAQQPGLAAKLEFHAGALHSLTAIADAYRARVGIRAEELALRDHANEIQTGHVQTAQQAIERDIRNAARRKSTLSDGFKLFGGALFGAGAGGLIAGTASTVADSTWLIVMAVAGTAIGLIGVFGGKAGD